MKIKIKDKDRLRDRESLTIVSRPVFSLVDNYNLIIIEQGFHEDLGHWMYASLWKCEVRKCNIHNLQDVHKEL